MPPPLGGEPLANLQRLQVRSQSSPGDGGKVTGSQEGSLGEMERTPQHTTHTLGH